MDFSAAYKYTLTPFDDLERGTTIPAQFVSSLAPHSSGGMQRQIYGPGIGAAIKLVVCGALHIYPGRPDSYGRPTWTVHYPAPNTTNASAQATLNLEADRVLFEEDAVGPYLAALLLGLTGRHAFESSAQALRALVKRARAWPLPEQQARTLSQDSSLRGAILQLSNTLYYEIRTHEGLFYGTLIPQGCPQDPDCPQPGNALELGDLLGFETRVPSPQSAIDPTLSALRLLSSGGSALLYGPAGTFKTESGKALALELGAKLIVMKGDPSVEAREFKGGAQAEGVRAAPLPSGDTLPELLRGLITATYAQNPFAWRDGPLAQAFLSAASGITVLLIDEVLRFQSEEIGVLMGAMDTVSRGEALSLGLPPSDFPLEERYHLLRLPNEEILTCSTRNLVWILTTNIGRDYLQAGNKLDTALRSRIDVCLHLETPDPVRLRGALGSTGADPALIQIALDLDAFVRRELSDPLSVFLRPLDARKLIAFLKITLTLELEGKSRAESLCRALELVAVPYLGELKDTASHKALYSGLKRVVLEALKVAEQSGKARTPARTPGVSA